MIITQQMEDGIHGIALEDKLMLQRQAYLIMQELPHKIQHY